MMFVAVKVLPKSMTRNRAAIARFEREVMAAAKLSQASQSVVGQDLVVFVGD